MWKVAPLDEFEITLIFKEVGLNVEWHFVLRWLLKGISWPLTALLTFYFQTTSNTLHYIHIEQLDKVRGFFDNWWLIFGWHFVPNIFFSNTDFRKPFWNNGISYQNVQHSQG